MVFCHPFVRCF